MDISSILESHRKAGRLKMVRSKVEPALEASTLLQQSEPSPVLLANVAGSKILANILPDRETLAQYLGVNPKNFLHELGAVLDSRVTRKGAGIVRKNGCYGEVEIAPGKFGKLPILTYYQSDGGPYLTAGVWIVRDPKHGINLSYHRMMMISPETGTVRIVEGRGMDMALKNSNGKAEVAICISAPAHVLFAAALSPEPGVNEMDLAAKFGKVELIRCKTVDLEVPVSCEMVIEGRFTGAVGVEGPFVDITGTVDYIRQQPVFEITRVACKKEPVHYTIVPGRSDHKTLMGIPKELDIYQEVSRVCRCLDVRITPGGASWLHAIIQIDKKSQDDAPKAMQAAFKAHRSLKHCVVVDKDIDVSNPSDVEWALATRFQADKDLHILKGQPASSLDPSACHEKGKKSTSSKLGLDATIKSDDFSAFKRITA